MTRDPRHATARGWGFGPTAILRAARRHPATLMVTPAPAPIQSPCIGLCHLGVDGLCEGCRRSAEEIGRWRDMSAAERRHLMEEVLPLREVGS